MIAQARPVSRVASVALALVTMCSVLGLSAASSFAAVPPPPASVPAGPTTAAAIAALKTERDLTRQAGQLPLPTPNDLLKQIAAVDDRGAQLLVDLTAEGYTPSANLVATLGHLPPPTADGPPRPPPPERYDDAIRELGGDPGPPPPNPGPPPPNQGPPPRPPDTAASGWTTTTTGLVIAVVVLSALVVVMFVVMMRRRRDKRLVELAMTDSLTGLYNRRRLDHDLLACSAKQRLPVGVLMVDVDNFKTFNDTRGHSAGDRVLQEVGSVLSQTVRSKDVVYRYGGEEFCVLLPNAGQTDAMMVAERIRVATSQLRLPDTKMITVSVGVALGLGADVMETLDRADAALYDAKRDGRDRVALAASV